MEKRKKRLQEEVIDLIERVEFLHSGSHLLNLPLSGKAKGGGWARGHIINIVGDGSSGKTLLALEVCAWALYNIMSFPSKLFAKVKKVTIVYNNKEGVMDFPLEKMYGKGFESGIEWIHSETCEHFGRDFQRRVQAMEKGDFLLYIMDSMDALDSEASIKRIEKSIKSDKEEDGTFGTEKPKYFSKSFFSRLCSITRGKDATLVCISQVRQNIGAGLFEERYIRSGGKAMDFYTHQVCWLRLVKKLRKTFPSGRKKMYGTRIKATLRRSKVGKSDRDIDFDSILNHGLDDVGSVVKFLYPSDKNKLKIIQELEQDKDKFNEAIQKVQDVWDKEERASEPIRAGRFP